MRLSNSRTDLGCLAVRLARGSTLGVLLGMGALGVAVSLQACSDAGETTSGRRVLLHTRVEMDAEAAAAFTNPVGWQITLSKAVLATDAFYYFDGAPPLVSNQPRLDWTYASRWLGLGVAHAHPGHYEAGNAMGEMLEPSSIDLFAGTAEYSDGSGVSGVYRSARFSFASRATGPVAEQLEGHVAVVEGTASKDGAELRYFRATADLVDVAKSADRGEVEGCEFHEVDVQGDGTVTVVIDPRVWFDLTDFSAIASGSAGAPTELPLDSQPKIAFAQGLAQLSAYKFSYLSL